MRCSGAAGVNRCVVGLMSLAMIGAGAAMPAVGQDAGPPPRTAAAIGPLLDCRRIADRDARLGCFDREATAMAGAIERRDVVVADRGEITRVRRSMFGLTTPGVDVLNKDRPRKERAVEPGVVAIDAKIARASQDGYGAWLMVLDDGARWRQIDDRRLVRDPAPGMAVHIRRAAMGSFLANVGGQIAIRVRRVG